jgi:8-oxo-dGTP pyrophosphatase MutT (NUDIX family)
MTKTLLGINLDSIKFEKSVVKNSTEITLELILKGNWHPQTRQDLSVKKSFVSQDELLKFAVSKLKQEQGLPKFWSKNFLPNIWLIRLLSFALFFVVEWITNYFEIFFILLKNKQQERFYNQFKQIYAFTWLFTVQEFMQYGRSRITVINIVENRQDKFLLALRRHQWIPGDEGWGWFQGGLEVDEELEFLKECENYCKQNVPTVTTDTTTVIPNNETVTPNSFQDLNTTLPEKAQLILINRGRQEIKEETDLDLRELNVLQEPKYSCNEFMSVSIKRFLLLGCQYNVQQKYRVYWFYSKDSHKIKTDFENAGGDWFDKEQVGKKLVPEKLRDWEEFLKV